MNAACVWFWNELIKWWCARMQVPLGVGQPFRPPPPPASLLSSNAPAAAADFKWNLIWKLVNNSHGVVVCRSLCHYGLFLVCLREDVCMCASACLGVCWWGRGSGSRARMRRLLAWSFASLSPSRCRWTQSELTHPFRFDPQILSTRQQRDYGRNRLICFCEFTYAKCLPHKPWHHPNLREQKDFSDLQIFHYPQLLFL